MAGTRARLLALALGAAAAAGAAGGAQAGERHEYLGDFRVTYYWVAVEDARFAGRPRTERLRDVQGRVLARVSREFRRELDREGTGRTAGGRVLNVARRVAGEWRYEALAAGWGRGATGALLEPFWSVAADPAVVPAGACLYLPAFEGLELAAKGAAHPGRFSADDRGSAIRGARLDVFIGDAGRLAAAERAVASHAATPLLLVHEEPPRELPSDLLAAGSALP